MYFVESVELQISFFVRCGELRGVVVKEMLSFFPRSRRRTVGGKEVKKEVNFGSFSPCVIVIMSRSRAIDARLEKLIPSMEELLVVGIVQREEVREIARQRTTHEYRLASRPLLLLDVHYAIEFELNLERQIASFCSKTKLTLKHRWAVVERLEYIYKVALKRLRDPGEKEQLRVEFVAFLKQFSRNSSLSRLYAQLVQKHPTVSRYWIEAVKWECDAKNFEVARNLIHKATRLLQDDEGTWLCALDVELQFCQSLLHQIASDEAVPGPERAPKLEQENAALAKVVLDIALGREVVESCFRTPSLSRSCSFFKDVLQLCLQYNFTAQFVDELTPRIVSEVLGFHAKTLIESAHNLHPGEEEASQSAVWTLQQESFEKATFGLLVTLFTLPFEKNKRGVMTTREFLVAPPEAQLRKKGKANRPSKKTEEQVFEMQRVWAVCLASIGAVTSSVVARCHLERARWGSAVCNSCIRVGIRMIEDLANSSDLADKSGPLFSSEAAGECLMALLLTTQETAVDRANNEEAVKRILTLLCPTLAEKSLLDSSVSEVAAAAERLAHAFGEAAKNDEPEDENGAAKPAKSAKSRKRRRSNDALCGLHSDTVLQALELLTPSQRQVVLATRAGRGTSSLDERDEGKGARARHEEPPREPAASHGDLSVDELVALFHVAPTPQDKLNAAHRCLSSATACKNPHVWKMVAAVWEEKLAEEYVSHFPVAATSRRKDDDSNEDGADGPVQSNAGVKFLLRYIGVLGSLHIAKHDATAREEGLRALTGLVVRSACGLDSEAIALHYSSLLSGKETSGWKLPDDARKSEYVAEAIRIMSNYPPVPRSVLVEKLIPYFAVVARDMRATRQLYERLLLNEVEGKRDAQSWWCYARFEQHIVKDLKRAKEVLFRARQNPREPPRPCHPRDGDRARIRLKRANKTKQHTTNGGEERLIFPKAIMLNSRQKILPSIFFFYY